MEKITNDNCAGLCMEKTCDKRYTHFQKITINELELFICLCDYHAETYEEEEWKNKKEVKKKH